MKLQAYLEKISKAPFLNLDRYTKLFWKYQHQCGQYAEIIDVQILLESGIGSVAFGEILGYNFSRLHTNWPKTTELVEMEGFLRIQLKIFGEFSKIFLFLKFSYAGSRK